MFDRFATAALLVGSTLLAGPAALAGPTAFDFADPKGVNGIVFILDSDIEPIVGTGTGLTGTVQYDPADPASFSGSISVPTAQLRGANARMTGVLHSDQWMDAENHAQVTVTFDEVLDARPAEDAQGGDDDANGSTEAGDTDADDAQDGKVFLTVKGRVQFAGVEIEKEFEVLATHLPDAAPERGQAEAGDLLVLRSEFTVSRRDLGIKPDMGPRQVADEVHLIVPIVGYSK